jgi:hypothetical protein
MNERDFTSLDLSFRETIKRRDHTYEVTVALYSISKGDFIASFSTSTRITDGVQILTTNTQFAQQKYLTIGQINEITDWLRECALAARWRLTTYTTLVEVRP